MAWKTNLSVLLSLTVSAQAQSIPTASQCPSANGQTVTDSNGSTYRVTCSADNNVGSYANTGASSSYLDCMTACDAAASAGCQGFTYVGGTNGVGSGTCWLKKSMGSYPSAPNNYISAIRVTNALSSSKSGSASTLATSISSSVPAVAVSSSVSAIPASSSSATTGLSCPSSNFTTFVDTQGTNWQILCGFDTSPGSFGSTSASSFPQCLAACEATTNCVAVTYVGTACYFKKGFSSLISNPSASSAFMVNTQNYPVPASGNTKASSGCGSALPAGVQLGGSSTTFQITSNGVVRSFNVHVPTSYKNNKAAPLIVAYHGRSNNQLSVESDSQLSSETWNPYAISVYPLGINEQWEGDPDTVGGNYDDLGFTNDLLDHMSINYCIDTSRMLAAGFSNGGGFVGTLACDPTLSTRFSTFAANSGAEYTNTTGTCNPPSVLTNTIVQPVCSPGRTNLPMLEFHGDADGTIPYHGGPRRGYCLPTVPHWVTDWALRDGLSSSNVTTSLAGGNVTKYEFGASQGVQGLVTHYKVAGWGHAWVSSRAGAPIDATPIVMDFFYAHSG